LYIFLSFVFLLIQYFCTDYDRGIEKADLSKGHCNPKRKLWVTTHFLEMIEKALKYRTVLGIFFPNLSSII